MKSILILFLTFLIIKTNGQNHQQSAFTFSYNFQLPFGELSKKFGSSSSIGSSYFFETSRNYLYGIEANFLFGDNIKVDNIFDNISTSSQNIINAEGQYANINLMQRGVDSYLFSGYVIHTKKNTSNGFYIYQGIGYIQHKIFIDTKNQNIPQLNENMKKGYDNFSNGLSTKFSVDYRYYDRNNKFQISIGINYTIASTKIQREYNFNEEIPYPKNRNTDMLLGFKVDVIIPVNRKNTEEFHYF